MSAFCCWCAQDISANYFWESMGFVPLAFRAGSEKKSRVHIFWQKRVRQGDTETPWWFPAKTDGGAMREDRLVLPIPPGTHWSDEMPVRVLPREPADDPQRIAGGAPGAPRSRSKPAKKPEPKRPLTTAATRLYFAPPPPPKAEKAAKPKREKKPKARNDPRLVAAARELRDRYLEHVNADPSALMTEGKYDVSRRIEEGGHRDAARQVPLLGEAAAA